MGSVIDLWPEAVASFPLFSNFQTISLESSLQTKLWGDYFSPQFEYLKVSFYPCTNVTSPGLVCQDALQIKNYLAQNALQFLYQESTTHTDIKTGFISSYLNA
jgi:hypothetical protein